MVVVETHCWGGCSLRSEPPDPRPNTTLDPRFSDTEIYVRLSSGSDRFCGVRKPGEKLEDFWAKHDTYKTRFTPHWQPKPEATSSLDGSSARRDSASPSTTQEADTEVNIVTEWGRLFWGVRKNGETDEEFWAKHDPQDLRYTMVSESWLTSPLANYSANTRGAPITVFGTTTSTPEKPKASNTPGDVSEMMVDRKPASPLTQLAPEVARPDAIYTAAGGSLFTNGSQDLAENPSHQVNGDMGNTTASSASPLAQNTQSKVVRTVADTSTLPTSVTAGSERPRSTEPETIVEESTPKRVPFTFGQSADAELSVTDGTSDQINDASLERLVREENMLAPTSLAQTGSKWDAPTDVHEIVVERSSPKKRRQKGSIVETLEAPRGIRHEPRLPPASPTRSKRSRPTEIETDAENPPAKKLRQRGVDAEVVTSHPHMNEEETGARNRKDPAILKGSRVGKGPKPQKSRAHGPSTREDGESQDSMPPPPRPGRPRKTPKELEPRVVPSSAQHRPSKGEKISQHNGAKTPSKRGRPPKTQMEGGLPAQPTKKVPNGSDLQFPRRGRPPKASEEGKPATHSAKQRKPRKPEKNAQHEESAAIPKSKRGRPLKTQKGGDQAASSRSPSKPKKPKKPKKETQNDTTIAPAKRGRPRKTLKEPKLPASHALSQSKSTAAQKDALNIQKSPSRKRGRPCKEPPQGPEKISQRKKEPKASKDDRVKKSKTKDSKPRQLPSEHRKRTRAEGPAEKLQLA